MTRGSLPRQPALSSLSARPSSNSVSFPSCSQLGSHNTGCWVSGSPSDRVESPEYRSRPKESPSGGVAARGRPPALREEGRYCDDISGLRMLADGKCLASRHGRSFNYRRVFWLRGLPRALYAGAISIGYVLGVFVVSRGQVLFECSVLPTTPSAPCASELPPHSTSAWSSAMNGEWLGTNCRRGSHLGQQPYTYLQYSLPTYTHKCVHCGALARENGTEQRVCACERDRGRTRE